MALETPEKRNGIRNPHLQLLSEDFLYHLNLSTSTHDLPKMFGDVKFVCMGGTKTRMLDLASYIFKQLGLEMQNEDSILPNIIEDSDRYAMYKAGPVLCVSHGIGSPSLSVVLHEVHKLLHYANAKNVIFLRVGSSGGIGLEPGSIVITSESLNGRLRPYHDMTIIGRAHEQPCILNSEIIHELQNVGEQYMPAEVPIIVGKTMCADDFYEGQGRLDGALCDYNEQEREAFIKRLKSKGVVNIEMECTTFGAFCARAGIKAGIVCVTLLDRTKGDQIRSSKTCIKQWEHRLMHFIYLFIKEKLGSSSNK